MQSTRRTIPVKEKPTVNSENEGPSSENIKKPDKACYEPALNTPSLNHPQTAPHNTADSIYCQVRGCGEVVRAAFMCGHHWRQVPVEIMRAVWIAYAAGQVTRGVAPSPAWIAAARNALRSVEPGVAVRDVVVPTGRRAQRAAAALERDPVVGQLELGLVRS